MRGVGLEDSSSDDDEDDSDSSTSDTSDDEFKESSDSEELSEEGVSRTIQRRETDTRVLCRNKTRQSV